MTLSKSILACCFGFSCVPVLNAQQIKVGRPQLEIVDCSMFKLQWNDRGSGAAKDGAFWRPVKSGYFAVGDLALGNYEEANGDRSALVIKDGVVGATRKPVDYKRVWIDAGSGASKQGSIWQPIPPQGYVAMGCVAQTGYNKPGPDAVRCVRKDLVTRGELSDAIWSDDGSGATEDVSVHEVRIVDRRSTAPETFVTNNKYSTPRSHSCAYVFSGKAKSRRLTVRKGIVVLKVFTIESNANRENRQTLFEVHKVAKDFTIPFAEDYSKGPLPPKREKLRDFKDTIEAALTSVANPQVVNSKLEKDNTVKQIDGSKKTWRATVLIDGYLDIGNDYVSFEIRDGGTHRFGLSDEVKFQSYEYGSVPAP